MTPASSTAISTATRIAAGTSVMPARNLSSRASGRAATSAERTDLALQDGPGFGAVLLLPLGVEAGTAQRGAEFFGVGRVESHALLGQRALQRCVKGAYVLALKLRRRIEVELDDLLQVLRYRGPDAAIGERPEPVPHVVGQRDEFLHLVELVE